MALQSLTNIFLHDRAWTLPTFNGLLNPRCKRSFTIISVGFGALFSPIFFPGSSSLSVARAAELKFDGSSLKVLEVSPESSTGLDKIYVVYDVAGVSVSYTSTSGSQPRWLRYGNMGGGYAEEVAGIVYDGNVSTLPVVEGDKGYIIEDGERSAYFWIVNYKPHRFSIRSVEPSLESDCDASLLSVTGEGAPIHFYTISGQQKVLNRDIEVAYSTLQWNADQKLFQEVGAVQHYEYLPETISVRPAALCPTEFTVSGDIFLKQWNWLQTATSSVISPSAVEAYTEAIQESDMDSSNSESEIASNLIKGDDTLLGGSAPCVISFLAYPSDGVLHHEWQMSRSENFEDVEYRFNVQDFEYTFMDEGTFFLRYIGSNSDGSCEAVSDTYTVSVGASELLCPNTFSPNGDGVNDEWKVAYRSLIEFKCWIFDRYGNQVFHFADPSLGWDGTRGGKPVKSGVYYYVIQAVGSDGKKYNVKGDINILRSNKGDSSTSDSAMDE